MSDCNCHTETIRDGSGQLGRYLKALDPAYAAIDSRNLKDLLVFAKRYAAEIRFYDVAKGDAAEYPKNTTNWSEFFSNDMAVIAASISSTGIQKIENDYAEVRSKLDLQPTVELFKALFGPIVALAQKVDRWFTIAVPENPLHADVDLAIESVLKSELKKMIAYAEGFRYVEPKRGIHLDLSGLQNDVLWGLDRKVVPNFSIYEGVETADKIRSGALFIDDVFHAFLKVVIEITAKGDQYFKYALEKYPGHQPHMALFIAFLQIFEVLQQQMNGIPERMLQFYYNDVLRLQHKPAVPDKVFVVFELAKDIAGYNLAEGTALKAGKDKQGKEQVYTTTSAVVLNQAKVKELKTIRIEKIPAQGEDDQKEISQIFARPVANSKDGFGEPLTEPSKKWPTFGSGGLVTERQRNICEQINRSQELLDRKDIAQVGFAVASPQLMLHSGNRLVTLAVNDVELLQFAQKAADKGKSYFDIWLSGETGWLKISTVMTHQAYKTFSEQLNLGVFNANSTAGTSYYIDIKNQALQIFLPLAEMPIVGFDKNLHSGYDLTVAHPVLLVLINGELGIPTTTYANLTIDSLQVRTKVGSINPPRNEAGNETFAFEPHFDGLRKLIVQNDNGVVETGKPFDPFTAYPAPGRSFYIGSNEVFNKPLGRLAVNLRKTVETNQNFAPVGFNSDAANNGHEYRVSVLQNRSFTTLSTETGSDFNTFHLTQNILYRPVAQPVEGPPAKPLPVELARLPLVANKQYSIDTIKGFLKITNLLPVNSDNFFSASQAMSVAMQISEVSVSYESELRDLEAGTDHFYHIYPFGAVEIYLDATAAFQHYPANSVSATSSYLQLDRQSDDLLVNAHRKLLPQFTFQGFYWPGKKQLNEAVSLPGMSNQKKASKADTKNSTAAGLAYTLTGMQDRSRKTANQYSGKVQEEGLLFIGLEKLQPLQSVNLLFQFAEGSAEDEDNDPPTVNWSYLSHNEWRPLQGEDLVSDGTFGFQTTGIIKLNVPADANLHNSIITNGLLWYCASVTDHSERFPQLISVVAQAVLAEFNDDKNDPAHYDNPLTANSISKLAVAATAVSKVSQPFSSFNGKHAEVGKEYYTRISERLRHKSRAITPWDYEHLVLEHFPSIFKVKCITHTDPNCFCRHAINVNRNEQADEICCGPQVAPGHVLLVPIANLKNRNATNILQPKTSRRTLLEIEQFLKQRTSPFVHIRARNPLYEQIIVSFKVQFYTGTDKGFYLKQLNDDLVQYLTPWAFDEKIEVSFNQKIYASSVINFIEERAYVDFITDFKMAVCKNECCPPDDEEQNEDDEGPDVLNTIEDCDDMERLLERNTRGIGEVAVSPSTSRSILVSVPQHIIIPYIASPVVSRCQQREAEKVSVSTSKDTRLNQHIEHTITIAAEGHETVLVQNAGASAVTASIVHPNFTPTGPAANTANTRADEKTPLSTTSTTHDETIETEKDSAGANSEKETRNKAKKQVESQAKKPGKEPAQEDEKPTSNAGKTTGKPGEDNAEKS